MKTIPKNQRTLLRKADRCPPFLCIALARQKRKRIPLAELSERAGVSKRMLLRLQTKTSWANVKLGVVDSVMEACGISLPTIGYHVNYVKETIGSARPFHHLHRRQWKTLLRLMGKWLEEQKRD